MVACLLFVDCILSTLVTGNSLQHVRSKTLPPGGRIWGLRWFAWAQLFYSGRRPWRSHCTVLEYYLSPPSVRQYPKHCSSGGCGLRKLTSLNCALYWDKSSTYQRIIRSSQEPNRRFLPSFRLLTHLGPNEFVTIQNKAPNLITLHNIGTRPTRTLTWRLAVVIGTASRRFIDQTRVEDTG